MAALTTICMIACHGGPAEHFNVFARELELKGCKVEIYATGPALQKFGSRIVTPFSIEDGKEEQTALELASKCKSAAAIITDVGHPFNVTLQSELKRSNPDVTRFAYYDNPEAFVPGGYSEVAEQVMQLADRVLYANANLAIGDLAIGIGYYPVEKADTITLRRKTDRETVRKALSLEPDQKLLVYAGGNNEVYFSKAFPAFLNFLAEGENLSGYVVMLQQHPGAKEQNRDGGLVAEWISEHGSRSNAPKVIVSEMSSDDAQVAADAMLYYQTSMGPQFVLAGIPTMQVGHETYYDVLVKNDLCPVATNADAFEGGLRPLLHDEKTDTRDTVTRGLGICVDWKERLAGACKIN